MPPSPSLDSTRYSPISVPGVSSLSPSTSTVATALAAVGSVSSGRPLPVGPETDISALFYARGVPRVNRSNLRNYVDSQGFRREIEAEGPACHGRGGGSACPE